MTRRHDSPREHAVPGRFAGQTAIVTGSTRGIGAGIAERLAAEGANVVVSGRSEDAGEAVVERIDEATGGDAGDAVFVRADMRDPEDVAALAEAAVAAHGSLDVLVNNAGVQTETAADEASLDDWAFVVETDFRAYWLAARAALEHMDRGAIVNVSSNHAHASISRAVVEESADSRSSASSSSSPTTRGEASMSGSDREGNRRAITCR